MDQTLATLTDLGAAWRSLTTLALYVAVVLGVLYALTGLGVRR